MTVDMAGWKSVDIDFLLDLLSGDNQDAKYVVRFQQALTELKAARKLLQECDIRHPGENNPLSHAMREYHEVINA